MVKEQLIPARFLLTMGHFIALLMVPFTKDDNVYAALSSDPSSSQYRDGAREVKLAVVFGCACLFFDMLGLIGSSLFMNRVNVVQILFHFVGGILVSTFIHERWPYTQLWPLVICFNFPTALIEIGVLLATHVFQVVIF